MNRRTGSEQPFLQNRPLAQRVGFGPAMKLIALLALGACSTAPPSPLATEGARSSAESGAGPTPFSGDRVLENLGMLIDAGSRRPGSPSATRAAEGIADALQSMGAEVEVWQGAAAEPHPTDASVGAVVGILEGESPDPVLLVARYDTLPVERDRRGPKIFASATGAAMVLELGRVLAQASRPYSVWLLFLEGDGLAGVPGPTPVSAPSAEALNFPGSHAAAAELEARQMAERVRLAIFFGFLPGPKFVLERDLRSHRMFREAFWQSAKSLDGALMFPETDTFSSPQAGHLAFLAQGVRPTVALIGQTAGTDSEGADSAAIPSRLPDAGELERLGRVTLDAIDRITLRLDRLEAFAKSPLGEAPGASTTDSSSTREEDTGESPNSSKAVLD
jgi:hypothetical protein